MDVFMRGIGGAAWEVWRWSTHDRRMDDGSWIVDDERMGANWRDARGLGTDLDGLRTGTHGRVLSI